MKVGELVVELAVLVVEFADALVRESEALLQRCDGSAFGAAVRVGGGLWIYGEPANVVAELGLGVEPGAGDAGMSGDLGDGVLIAGFASSRRARRARSRVSALRRRAALTRWWLLSGCIG